MFGRERERLSGDIKIVHKENKEREREREREREKTKKIMIS